ELTSTEFKLLSTLALRRGRVQSREALLRDVWEYDSLIDTRTVDTHMRRLREKLGSAAKYLGTVRGVGYRFVDKRTGAGSAGFRPANRNRPSRGRHGSLHTGVNVTLKTGPGRRPAP